MHEDLLSKTLGRVAVLKMKPTEFQETKEACYAKLAVCITN